MSQDLYKLLDVDRKAGASDIRSAYLKLSRIYHPDKAPADKKEEYEAKFKEVLRAYEVLSDEDKRTLYDHTGQVAGEGRAPDGGMGGMGSGFPFDMNGLFGMFGGGGRPVPKQSRRPGKAPARKTQIPLTLKDFYYGRTLQMNLERQRFCGGCKGDGALNRKSCEGCGGIGVINQVVQMGPMIMQSTGACQPCGGSGRTVGDKCSQCNGAKFHKQEKQLELVVGKGMKPGDVVTFVGESSHVDEYTEAGDVVVELVAADEDHGWERFGDQLKHRVGLTLGESLCGKVVRLDGHPAHPDGIYIQIPSGIQNRQEIIVEGLGMPRAIGGGFGDAVLVLTVLASKEEKEILEAQRSTLRELFKADAGPTEHSLIWVAKPLVY